MSYLLSTESAIAELPFEVQWGHTINRLQLNRPFSSDNHYAISLGLIRSSDIDIFALQYQPDLTFALERRKISAKQIRE